MRSERLPLLLDQSLVGVYALKGGTVAFVNGAAAGLLGYTPGEMIGRSIADFIHPDDRELARTRLAERFAKPGLSVRYRLRALHREGHLVHAEVHGTGVEVDGEPGVSGVLIDVSDLVQAEASQRRADARLRQVLDHMDWMAVFYDLDGRIEYANEALLRFAGLARERVVGADYFELFVPAEERESRKRSLADATFGSPSSSVEREMISVGGERRVVAWNLLPLRDDQGALTSVAAIGLDVTESRRDSAQLRHDSFHDRLTGLPNRALFLDRLTHRLRLQERRREAQFAVLALDVDRFKLVNDSLGHVRGDELLLAISRRLQRCVRPGDTIARQGGDEFVLLLEDLQKPQDALGAAERIQDELRSSFLVGGSEVFVSASVGVALGSADYRRAEDVLRDADTAMYRAKAQGRARTVQFEAGMHDRAVRLLALDTDLRRALERRELRLHYQPIVSLGTSRISGAEALLRWQHPERGLVPPLEFVPLAEETGLILELGAWVLREACVQMRGWQEKVGDFSLQVGVNLSSKQLMNAGLVEQVRDALRESGLPAECLRLEVTESVLIDAARDVAQTMAELRGLGVRLDLDDFGTGYSSLSYLHQFPLDALKIDRSFVARLGGTDNGAQIVNTIVALAKSLKLDVIAEGVETAEQLTALRELHCGFAQGFHLSRPVEPAHIEALLRGEGKLGG